MAVSHSGECQHEKIPQPSPADVLVDPIRFPRLVTTGPVVTPANTADFSRVDLGESVRVSLMLTPQGRGPLKEQVLEILSAIDAALAKAGHRMVVTFQTVFLRDPACLKECEQIFAKHYGAESPVTSFVLQPPCSGAALAVEAWAIGGPGVRIERLGSHTRSVTYHGVRWVHCAGICSKPGQTGVYAQTTDVLKKLRAALELGNSGFEHVVRTWFYLGDITGAEGESQRYKEFNRARADFYQHVSFGCSYPFPSIPQGIYPASTGIGMNGTDLVAGCLALQTKRKDAFLLPLENPQQTPAYAYHPKYSPQSPKFSRAKALILGGYITTWISGTASVVHSESLHPADVQKQTHQTIDNIEHLLAPDNFAFHGIRGAGAGLRDLAKIRIYLKRAEDFPKCKAICESRFGPVPAIYAVADICRPELLVEIEGVAFSRCSTG
jgi:enamine deaminase RidA (YjgF/YER057c/UK114 family)